MLCLKTFLLDRINFSFSDIQAVLRGIHLYCNSDEMTTPSSKAFSNKLIVENIAQFFPCSIASQNDFSPRYVDYKYSQLFGNINSLCRHYNLIETRRNHEKIHMVDESEYLTINGRTLSNRNIHEYISYLINIVRVNVKEFVLEGDSPTRKRSVWFHKEIHRLLEQSKESVRKIYGLEKLCGGCPDCRHFLFSTTNNSLIPMPMMGSLNLPKKKFDSLRISSRLLRTVGQHCLRTSQNITEILKSFTRLTGTETACDDLIFVIGDDEFEMYPQEIMNYFIAVLNAKTATIQFCEDLQHEGTILPQNNFYTDLSFTTTSNDEVSLETVLETLEVHWIKNFGNTNYFLLDEENFKVAHIQRQFPFEKLKLRFQEDNRPHKLKEILSRLLNTIDYSRANGSFLTVVLPFEAISNKKRLPRLFDSKGRLLIDDPRETWNLINTTKYPRMKHVVYMCSYYEFSYDMVQFEIRNTAKNVTVNLEVSFEHETLKRFVNKKQNLSKNGFVNYFLDFVK